MLLDNNIMSKISSVGFLTLLKNKGISYEQFCSLTNEEQLKFYCSRIRRSLNRLSEPINKFSPLQRIYANAIKKNNYKIQKKALIILPVHVGKNFQIYNGKEYIKTRITVNMVGKRVGMFVMCKKFPNHNKAAKARGKVK